MAAGKSEVWVYYDKICKQTANCKTCTHTIKHCGNTTNLRNHLERKHPQQFRALIETKRINIKAAASINNDDDSSTTTASSAQLSGSKEPVQQKIGDLFAKAQKYEAGSKRRMDIDDAVVRFLAKDGLPIYSVEKSGLSDLLRVLDSRYELPSRRTVTRSLLPKLYNDTVLAVQATLATCDDFACSCDFWSSSTSDPYLAVTVHFIDHKWQFISKCLQCTYTPERHIAENVDSAITNALENWSLKVNNLSALTTDNATNMIKACTLLKVRRMRCFGHCLHLAIGKGLQDDRVTRAINICRRISSYFTQSFNRKSLLLQAQRDLKLPEKMMVSDCETRWSAKYHLIDRILSQEKAIRQVICDDRKSTHLLLSWQDEMVLRDVHKVLKPLDCFTDLLSGESDVTVSMVIPLLQSLRDILKLNEDDSELANQIRSSILDDIMARYCPQEEDYAIDIQHVLHVACYLDPRFKHSFVKNKYRLQQRVVDDCKMLCVENNDAAASANANVETTHVDVDIVNKRPKLSSLLPDMNKFDESADVSYSQSLEEKVSSEIALYEATNRLDRDGNVLEW